MDRDLLQKMISEQPLTAEESLRLDEALARQDESLLVKSLAAHTNDEPSLAWRSALNSRLGRSAGRARRAKFLGWGAGTAAVAAAALALVTLMTPPAPSPSLNMARSDKASLEELLITEHRDAVTRASLDVPVPVRDRGRSDIDWSSLE